MAVMNQHSLLVGASWNKRTRCWLDHLGAFNYLIKTTARVLVGKQWSLFIEPPLVRYRWQVNGGLASAPMVVCVCKLDQSSWRRQLYWIALDRPVRLLIEIVLERSHWEASAQCSNILVNGQRKSACIIKLIRPTRSSQRRPSGEDSVCWANTSVTPIYIMIILILRDHHSEWTNIQLRLALEAAHQAANRCRQLVNKSTGREGTHFQDTFQGHLPIQFCNCASTGNVAAPMVQLIIVIFKPTNKKVCSNRVILPNKPEKMSAIGKGAIINNNKIEKFRPWVVLLLCCCWQGKCEPRYYRPRH